MADGSARAWTGNAADPEQIQAATRRGNRRDGRRVDIIRQQLSTPLGREFAWMEIEGTHLLDIIVGPMEEVFAANELANYGRRKWLEYQEQHTKAFLLMLSEALARQAQDTREVDAMHTPKSEDA